MAGITANTTSVTMAASEGVDVSKSGFSTGELCTLAVEPVGTTLLWTLTTPPGSTADLTGDSIASPSFRPDRQGIYTATVIVDGSTVYKIRMEAVKVAVDWEANGIRLAAVTPASVATPSSGHILFVDSTNSNALSLKDSAGAVSAV